MDDDSKFFCHLDFPELPDKYIEEAKNAEYTLISTPTLYTADSTFRETEFFEVLTEQFGQNVFVNYTLNPPNSSYEWHVDMGRTVAINWVIKTNPEARTFFKEPITGKDWNGMESELEEKPIIWRLTELKYNSCKPTILNVAHPHCVYNNWPKERIILSLSLEGPTYEDVVNFFLNHENTSLFNSPYMISSHPSYR